MRFLANENVPLASVRLLRQSGHDVVSASEEFPAASDSDVLARAVEERRIVLTFDRDYGELIFRRMHAAPPGVVYFRFEPETPDETADRLLGLLLQTGVMLEGRFTVVERGQMRQRPMAGRTSSRDGPNRS